MFRCRLCGRTIHPALVRALYGPRGKTDTIGAWADDEEYYVCNEGAKGTSISEDPIPHEPYHVDDLIQELLEIAASE